MKSLILGLIFVSISYLGFKVGDRFKKKEKFYYDFKNFLIYLKNEIGFFEKDILEIVSSYETKNSNLKLLLENYQASLNEKPFEELKILSKEENLKIIDFFNGVGASDCESQKEYIEKNLEIFNSCFEQAKLKNEKQGSMYKKLSILLGLLVCIVLI